MGDGLPAINRSRSPIGLSQSVDKGMSSAAARLRCMGQPLGRRELPRSPVQSQRLQSTGSSAPRTPRDLQSVHSVMSCPLGSSGSFRRWRGAGTAWNHRLARGVESHVVSMSVTLDSCDFEDVLAAESVTGETELDADFSQPVVEDESDGLVCDKDMADGEVEGSVTTNPTSQRSSADDLLFRRLWGSIKERREEEERLTLAENSLFDWHHQEAHLSELRRSRRLALVATAVKDALKATGVMEESTVEVEQPEEGLEEWMNCLLASSFSPGSDEPSRPER